MLSRSRGSDTGAESLLELSASAATIAGRLDGKIASDPVILRSEATKNPMRSSRRDL
jgi:hypothetical protein